MKDNSVLSRFGVSNDNAATENEGLDDLGSFGWLRGIRDRAIMLELRHKDGRISAFGYAWLKHVDFDPSGDLVLDFSGEKVRIRGQNLAAEVRPSQQLISGILRHRVVWSQEADETTLLEGGSSATVIEEIKLAG